MKVFPLFIPLLFIGCFQTRMSIQEYEDWTIVVADDALPSEKFAAEEFAALFHEATGIDLEIRGLAEGKFGNIFIGHSAAMAWSDVGFDVDDLGEEGLRIRSSEANLAIAGGRPRGTLYGVYEFFENYLGVRFLTADHTHIPDYARYASIPTGTYTYIPTFDFRWSYCGEVKQDPYFAARLKVNTVTDVEELGGVTSQKLINHSLRKLIPVEKYGTEHPEYYALDQGVRKLEMWGGGPEPCVTNLEVMDIVTEAVLKEIEAHPEQKNFSVSQNDNDAYCRCERCESVNQHEGSPMGAHLAFVNEIADRVKEQHPDKMIGTLAYWYTRKPPLNVRPRDNVQVQLADIEACRLHPLDHACPLNRAFKRDFEGWSEIAKQIYIWTYVTDFRYYDLPFPNLKAMAPNIKYFAQHNVRGLFMQSNGGGTSGDMSDLRNYLICRLMWDPSRYGWEEVEEFCRLHYGKAAPIILEYLERVHENAESRGCHPTCFATPLELGLNPDLAVELFGYFDRALEAVEYEVVKSRVEKISISAYRTMLEAGSSFQVKDGLLKRAFPEGYEDVVERYIALCKKHRMTMPDERTRFEAFEKVLKRDYTDGIPVTTLENDTWRLVFVPENNGKAMEMLHKPSGLNLVNAYRNNLRFGTFEEWTEKDPDHNAAPHRFEAEVEGSSVVLRRRFEDGSDYARTVSLDNETIRCKTTITHLGDAPKTYQIIVHPELNAGTMQHDSEILKSYVKKDGAWVQYNKGLVRDEGPDAHLLLDTVDGGAHAFFNSGAKFGMLQTYEAEQVEKLRTWWMPEFRQFNLELQTKAVELKKGETFTFRYAFEFLAVTPE